MNLIGRVIRRIFPKKEKEKIVEAVDDVKRIEGEVFSDDLRVKFPGNEMKEKLAQLANAFAEKNGLTIEMVKGVDESWDNSTCAVRELYRLNKEYSKDNIAQWVGLWLVRGKDRDCIRFNCCKFGLLGVISSELVEPIRMQFPGVDVWLIDEVSWATVYDSRSIQEKI